ncbi:MAG TPA: alpha/beta hydrolase [Gaiellaceae bacterium]|jgi:acetyl esterase/lipase|nr:alpha/beta hydrolase [Gaiellaceae bacterium]
MTVLDEATLAEARSFNEALAEVLAEEPQVHTVPPERSRRARREGRSVWPQPVFLSQARDLSVPARSGAIRVRVLAPEEKATGVYLHIHGGGWVLGCCDEQDDRLWALVEATGLCAVSVDYRLAPEHPYPAGPDDCEDAAVWLLDRGLTELDVPDRIAIGGESAGAHLAVTTLLRLRDRHGVSGAFQAANLDCGVYDLSGTPSRRNWGDRHPMLSTPDMVWFGRSFTGDRDLKELRDPDLSPLYAELHDLPPALFTVGDLDPLLDDSLFMAARWQSAGNRAELRVWPESIHGFTAFPLALARAANDAQHEFLRAAVSD